MSDFLQAELRLEITHIRRDLADTQAVLRAATSDAARLRAALAEAERGRDEANAMSARVIRERDAALARETEKHARAERAEAALTEAGRAMMTGWQPIETAPKNSTRRWLFFPHKSPDDRQCVGWWDDDYSCWIDHADSNVTDPTHWMPLPPPPQEAERT